MTDDEIAERIAKMIRSLLDRREDPPWAGDDIDNFMDAAEAYHLAFVPGVQGRAAARRQMKRVRAKVYATLGLTERKAEK
jgi:hypothetical protein